MGRAEDLFERLKKEGVQAIDDFIADRQSEEFFLDFKRSGDNGAGRKLHDDDRKNLSKTISGFANSEGGVIVWGVDCSQNKTGADVAKMKVPLVDSRAFKSRLDGAISGCTIPPHEKVESHAIEEAGASGYVATLIPKIESAPLYSVHRRQFYLRAGSNFEPAPPGVLAGMFGKRPTPNLTLQHFVGGFETNPTSRVLNFTWIVDITHGGPGLIRDVYFTAKFSVDKKINVKLLCKETRFWQENKYSDFEMSLVMVDGAKLGAFGHTKPLEIRLLIGSEIMEDFSVEFIYGFPDSQVFTETFIISRESLAEMHSQIFAETQLPNFLKCLRKAFSPVQLFSLYKDIQ